MAKIERAILHALNMAFAMLREIFWALALGFFILGIVHFPHKNRTEVEGLSISPEQVIPGVPPRSLQPFYDGELIGKIASSLNIQRSG